MLAIDFDGVHAWLDCLDRTPTDASGCRRASARTTGGTIAQLAETTFGDEPAPEYPTVSVDKVASLVSGMRLWQPAHVVAEVQSYLPRPAEAKFQAFVVANGHPWGDAYVRSVKRDPSGATLSPKGEPVILFNAVIIAATYPGSAEQQATDALGVLKHEVFHALFRKYRDNEPAWQQLPRRLDSTQRLLVTVLDEGIAHFAGDRHRLVKDGFPVDRGKKALTALADAVQRLGSLPADSAEAAAILRAANQGRYWEKFGSISGMLFAYGVFRNDGIDGLRESARCGPVELLARYERAAAGNPDLPPLPRQILEASTGLALCDADPCR